ncbi:MAG: lasso peptide biosynthesis B2 protein [Pseudomonadota bacterium]
MSAKDHTAKNDAPPQSRALTNAATHGSVRRRDLWRYPVPVMRGLIELAKARRALPRVRGSDIGDFNARAEAAQQGSLRLSSDAAHAVVDRIAVIIVNAARLVPWRSDCLVQAIAAQNWLTAEGLASQIEVGLPPDNGNDFAPHAWLICGGRVVTGGDVRDFNVLLGSSEAQNR